tara:strand:+ start:871 stop:1383 length:513 start_codon:yes stop_codon:yes gene_type:complete
VDGKNKRMIEKFKNLTLEGKVFYIFITFITIWFIMILSGCVSSIYKVRKENINDQVKVTHVLAVTEMGDTLKIPINEIKPKVIYNVVGYDYMRYNPYYSPYNNRYYYDYYPYNYSNSTNHVGTSFGISSIQPTTQIPVPNSGGNSGTSGFSGNPVASNPVTSGGGAKTKN